MTQPFKLDFNVSDLVVRARNSWLSGLPLAARAAATGDRLEDLGGVAVLILDEMADEDDALVADEALGSRVDGAVVFVVSIGSLPLGRAPGVRPTLAGAVSF